MKVTLKALPFLIGLSLSASAFSAELSITPGSGKTISLTDPTLSGRQVQIAVSSGTSHLEFSNGTGVLGGVPSVSIGGAVGIFNVIKAVPVAFDGVSVIEKTALYGGRIKSQKRFALNVDASIGSLSVDNVNNRITQVRDIGSFTLSAPFVNAVADGGLINFKNIRVDLNRNRVFADVTTTPLIISSTGQSIPGSSSTVTNVPMWDIAKVTGPVVVPVAALLNNKVNDLSSAGWTSAPNGRGGYDITGKITLGKLTLTNEGLYEISAGLGITDGSIAIELVNQVNTGIDAWGAKELSIKFSLPPQTCPI
jgi:hypothetical protein